MAASETMREFLVSLGFKSDEGSLKKFKEGIASATKAVVTLAAAVEASAIAVAYAVSKYASSMESLYFVSQRLGESAGRVRAFDLAMQGMGESAGTGMAMLDNMSQKLQTDQGFVNYLAHLGVHLKRLKDGSPDSISAIKDIATALRTLPMFSKGPYSEDVAWSAAQGMGFSWQQFKDMRNPDFNTEVDKSLKAAPNLDAAALAAKKFEDQMRSLKQTLEGLGAIVMTVLEKRLGGSIKDFHKFLQQHGKEIADSVVTIVNAILDVAQLLVTKLIELTRWFDSLDPATKKWVEQLAAALLILKFTGAGSIIGGVFSLAGGLIQLAGAATTASPALIGLTAAFAGLTGYLTGKYLMVPALDWLVQQLTGDSSATWESWAGRKMAENGEAGLSTYQSKSGPIGVRQNNPLNLGFAHQQGAMPGQYGLAKFASMSDGLTAAARQILLYRDKGRDTINDIITQWDKGDSPAGWRSYAADISKRMGGIDPNKHLALDQPQVLAALMNAMIWHEQGMNARPDLAAPAAARALKMETTINVNGSESPHAVAKAVSAEQKLLWADLSRAASATAGSR